MARIAAPKSKPTVVAVDTNVLLDLARGDETVLDCIDTIRKRLSPVRFVVSPTVNQELAEIADNGDTAKERESAALVLTKLVGEWKFSQSPFFDARASRARPAHGRSSVRVLRRGGV
jgi:rRNA-processing protein FCF1